MNIGVSSSVFSSNIHILSVVFGDQCEYVGENAFANCENLREINDDNEIKEIGSSAFAHCSNLTKITFNKLTTLHEGAFANCSNLTNIKIPNCTIIPQNAFCNCSSLSIDMTNLKEIGSNAFENCKNLKEINLNSCELIYDNAFMNCESLTTVILSSCSSIYPNAFLGCSSLNKVLIYNDSNTFCNLLSSTSFDKNTNALFYFKTDIISSYKSASNWSYFSSNMRILPADNQINYETTNKEPVRISADAYDYYGGFDKTTNKRFDPNDMITIAYAKNIDSIQKDIFHQDSIDNITEIQLPGSCEKIEESAFQDFTNLSNIILPNTLTTISDYAFKNCKGLYSVNIPQSITYLGEGIFEGCENISQISGKFVTYNNEAIVCNNTLIFVLPNIVTTGNKTLNTRIYNISDIDENITRLGKSCFYGCKDIGRVDIPSKIERIGDNCFYNSDIKEIHFEGDIPPEFGQKICGSGVRIFVPENSLSEYQNALTSSGGISADNIYPKPENDCIIYYSDNKISHLNNQEYINKNCTNGKYYRITNINNGILPRNYFNKQSEVTTVILSENIIEISQKAFENCEKLKYIYLPETLTTLGESCFCKCTNMRTVNIPSNVKKPKNNIFEECTALSSIKSYNKEYISTGDNRCFTHSGEIISFAPGFLGNEEVTYNIYGRNITSIYNKAFYKCTDGIRSNLRKIIVDDSIKTIGENAFGDSTLLESVSLSKSLTSIGDKAFYNCTNLTEIIFENNSSSSDSLDLETIGVSAFENCRKMVIKSDKDFGNITTIKENAFKNCLMFNFKNLSNVETDLNLKKVSNINNHTFYDCKNLKKITLNDNITTIGDYAFYNCTKLENPNLPNALTTIGNYAFSYCENLKSLNLPNTLTTIGNYAFSYCENFKGYNYIDDFNGDDFNGNENIRNVIVTQTNYILKIPKTVESIGTYCFRNTSIEKIEIDEDSALTKISDFAFYNCINLKTIDIKSQNLTHIGRFAFYNCTKLCENISNSNRLVLNNIKVVDDNAFGRCENITYISFSSNLESLGDRCLQNINTSAIVIISRAIPPIFTKNNISNYENSYPFGDKNTTGTTIPYIIVPNTYTYKSNKYWDIYKDDLHPPKIA